MQKIELKNASEVRKLVTTAYPSYRKHNAFLSEFHPMNINSYWDGGSRSEYVLVDLNTMRRAPLPTATHPYFDVARRGMQGENEVIQIGERGNITLKLLPEGFALIEAGTFCGKAATAHVYLNPANMTKMLVAG